MPTLRDRLFADLDPGAYPRLASLGERWAPLTAQDTYADGLRSLVAGLLAQAPPDEAAGRAPG